MYWIIIQAKINSETKIQKTETMFFFIFLTIISRCYKIISQINENYFLTSTFI